MMFVFFISILFCVVIFRGFQEYERRVFWGGFLFFFLFKAHEIRVRFYFLLLFIVNCHTHELWVFFVFLSFFFFFVFFLGGRCLVFFCFFVSLSCFLRVYERLLFFSLLLLFKLMTGRIFSGSLRKTVEIIRDRIKMAVRKKKLYVKTD